MEDKNLLALVRRMDDMERRIMSRIETLDKFRHKVIGGALVVSFVVSLIVGALKH